MGSGKDRMGVSIPGIPFLENRLSGLLKPVAPRREFVNGLGQRIQTGNRVALVTKLTNWHFMAFFIAGFLALAVFLAMLSRVLLIRFGKKTTQTN